MEFKVTAKVAKQLWTNDQTSWLYLVEEQQQDREKKWTVFCEQSLNLDAYYTFEGTVSESKDKKVKDASGKDIYRATFNAQKITSNEGSATGIATDDIPF